MSLNTKLFYRFRKEAFINPYGADKGFFAF